MNKRGNSRSEYDGLPVAEAVWTDNNPDVEAPPAEMESLISDNKKTGDNTHSKNNDAKDGVSRGFTVTNQDTQQYWGRFDDPQVEGTYTDEPAIATARPDDRHIRLLFIRKVYTILSVQLLTTFAICAFMAMNESAKQLVMGNLNFFWFNFIVAMGTLLPLHCYKRSYPTNMILLSIFTVAMATSK